MQLLLLFGCVSPQLCNSCCIVVAKSTLLQKTLLEVVRCTHYRSQLKGIPLEGTGKKEAEMINRTHTSTEYITCGAISVPVAMSLHMETPVDKLVAVFKSIITKH